MQQVRDGFALLCQLIAVDPRREHFRTLRDWLEPSVIRSCGLGPLKQVVVTVVMYAEGLPVPVGPSSPEAASLELGADAIAAMTREFPDTAMLYAAEVIVRRRLGDVEATLAVAEAGAARFPNDWSCASAMVNAFCDARKPELALHWAERAVAIDANDGSPLYDAGRAFIKAGRAPAAAAVFIRLLRQFPGYPEGEKALLEARSSSGTA